MLKKNYIVERRNLTGKALVLYKSGLELTERQKNILIGTLLGDASMARPLNKPSYYIKFEQKITQADYVHHLYEVFKPYVGTGPQTRVIKNSYHITPGQSCHFRTYGHKDFIPYYNLFYTNCGKGLELNYKKRVPRNIAELLTAEGLAYWFMDDGSSQRTSQGINTCFNFSTHGFSYEDQTLLRLTLENKFGLYSRIRKDKTFFRLYIKAESANKFVDLIRPYIRPSFLYKIESIKY